VHFIANRGFRKKNAAVRRDVEVVGQPQPGSSMTENQERLVSSVSFSMVRSLVTR
jgi:hypothetical protein